MIPDFKIEVEETKTYWQRVVSGPIVALFYIAFILIITACSTHFTFSGFLIFFTKLSLAVFVIIFFISSLESANFIRVFEIKNGYVHIEYTRRNKPTIIEGKVEEFSFSYFSNLYFSNLKIKQTTTGKVFRQFKGDWWDPFIKLVEYLKDNKIIR